MNSFKVLNYRSTIAKLPSNYCNRPDLLYVILPKCLASSQFSLLSLHAKYCSCKLRQNLTHFEAAGLDV
jgi:hypothetical protein